MGAINSVRRLTIQCLGLLEALEPTPVEIASKIDATADMQHRVQEKWPHLTLVPFGSSENGFGCSSSDLDLGLFFESHMDMDTLSWTDRLQILASVASIVTQDPHVTMKQFICHARVPLIKLWNDHRKLAIDISIGSPMARRNTLLLKRYGECDPRVRPLVFAVKHWAKQRGINDASNGSLSSYAWIMLVIFFLQTRRVVPCLRVDDDVVRGADSPRGPSLDPHDDTDMEASCDRPMRGRPDESVGSLLAAFFHFYAWEFDHRNNVVSIRCGQALPKQGKWGLGLGTWRFSIEDPIELHHDVARVIFHPKGQQRLVDELRRAAGMALLPESQLDELCAPAATDGCFICDQPGHMPRDCTVEATATLPPPAACTTPTNVPQPPSLTPVVVVPVAPAAAAPHMQVVSPYDKVLAKKRPRRRSKSKGGAKKKLMVGLSTLISC
ncbi:Aste57867_13445 [Aphanomyces stellatus]|uniref:Aste57867_13445 protein n=1 Tax=Aphanomyces stellatus TaxID=120398 RepID=A0A485KYE3_9STRA|nr:hypothetical protein As57867_013395 [Aphanomyces stellatus]VFT90283.1 Aste57867_13445 [Aphanomyces stellatus]